MVFSWQYCSIVISVGWLKFVSAAEITSMVFYWVMMPWLSWLVGFMAFLFVFFQMGLYWRTFDKLWERKISQNVIGIKRAPEPTKTLILCGHLDACWQWRYNAWGTLWFRIFFGGGTTCC